LLPRVIIQNLVGLPPFAAFMYMLVLGLSRSGILHFGFWALLGLCIFWLYFFTIEGLLLIYGLIRFDYATRVGRELNDCLKDLVRVLDEFKIRYDIRGL